MSGKRDEAGLNHTIVGYSNDSRNVCFRGDPAKLGVSYFGRWKRTSNTSLFDWSRFVLELKLAYGIFSATITA